MKSPLIKFDIKNSPEFFIELKKRVNSYFEDNNISKYANRKMKIKTIVLISLYFIPLVLLLTGVTTSVWESMLCWVLMGLGMSGIGLAVMHDANHGAYSSNQKVNNALSFLLNFLGGYHVNWTIQHNILHHTSTNVNEYDEDLTTPILRLSPDQKHKGIFRLQAYYATFFYAIMTLYWIIAKDFEQIVRYNKLNLLSRQGLTFKKALMEIIFHKTWYIVLVLFVPIFVSPLLWWQTLLGFLLMHFIGGLILTLIFQPAHVTETSKFYAADKNGSVENNWAIHQLYTTSNFANKSAWFTWYVGGLNFQIEHHLFPTICHIHYSELSKIVKATAKEYNLPYHQVETFYGALKSHYSLLNQLGADNYNPMLSTQK